MSTRADIEARLQSTIERAPRSPGVYLMRDSRGDVLYIGKAKDLGSRVRSYFGSTHDGRFQIDALIERVATIEFLVTGTEKDALLLENNLIKKMGPRFNIRLRDDKSFVILKINSQHPWPRALVTRGHKDDGSLYFGPYSSADNLRRTIKSLQRVFPLRLCSDHTLENRTRPCVYYDIQMCSAPCVDLVSREQYASYVDGLVMVLKGRDRTLIDALDARMQRASAERRYEQAAELRDQIQAIERTVERQRTEETGATYDRDVFGYSWEGDQLAIQVLFYRDGKMVNSGSHRFRALLPLTELLSSFLVQFYGGDGVVPEEVLLPVEIDDAPSIADWLSERASRRVRVHTPQRGVKRRQIELACDNAEELLRERQNEKQQQADLLDSLRDRLDLHNFPEVIECYDISHLAGGQTVGSRVTFVGGVADKNRYRRYRIRTPTGGDDYAALEEVLMRRLRRGLDGAELPDLIVIDGGRGQLERIVTVLNRLNIVGIDVIGLAKSRRRRRDGRAVVTDERVFRPGQMMAIALKQDSPENYLLMRVRDEAHRFAVAYHRHRRRRETLKSSLDMVPGVGAKRRKLLIRTFGSPAGVARAALEDLESVEGLGPAVARTIHAFFHRSEGDDDSPADDTTEAPATSGSPPQPRSADPPCSEGTQAQSEE